MTIQCALIILFNYLHPILLSSEGQLLDERNFDDGFMVTSSVPTRVLEHSRCSVILPKGSANTWLIVVSFKAIQDSHTHMNTHTHTHTTRVDF